jgi:hypothetical protein
MAAKITKHFVLIISGRGRSRVLGFITTYAISAYLH